MKFLLHPMRFFTIATSALSIALATVPAASGQQVQATAIPSITLDEAINRAKANEPNFAAAVAASGVSALDRSIARSALLPSVTYHNQFLYTQGTGVFISGTPPGSVGTAPRFIANNAVHEYTSQGVVNETIGLQQFTTASRASAAAAVAAANLEIARRGLVATVVGLFYNSLASENKVAVTKRAATEADSLVKLSEQREAGREAAHADVVKAQLQQQQRNRDLADSMVQAQKSRLDLGVLLFSDPRSPYALTIPATPSLPARTDVEAAAANHNPELQSALASLHESTLGVTAARAAYLPDLALNFAYGIDAAQFATTSADGFRNLGYSASATLDIPIWDWLSTQRRVKQSQILQKAARVALTSTQRQLIAQLDEDYAEATTARDQLASLDMSVQTAAESLRLTRLRYTAGEATVLEVVDAENSLTTAELAREDGMTRYQLSLANLQLLTGTI